MRFFGSPLLAFASVLSCVCAAHGAFFLEVENKAPVLPGTTITINVSARSDTGTQLVSGFDLKFDILPPAGVGRPAGIANAPDVAGPPDLPFLSNPVFTAPGTVTRINTANADIYVNGDYGGGSFLSVGANPTTLFTMRFVLASNLAPGTYGVNLVDTRPGGAFGVYNSAAQDIAALTFVQGSINVVAVPEPSSCGLLAFVLAGAAARRFSRR